MRLQIAVLFIAFSVSGCASVLGEQIGQTVATAVQTLDKPVATRCKIKWPKKPEPLVANVQFTGDDAVDALNIERAKEAELEQQRAYQTQLDAAASACVSAE